MVSIATDTHRKRNKGDYQLRAWSSNGRILEMCKSRAVTGSAFVTCFTAFGSTRGTLSLIWLALSLFWLTLLPRINKLIYDGTCKYIIHDAPREALNNYTASTNYIVWLACLLLFYHRVLCFRGRSLYFYFEIGVYSVPEFVFPHLRSYRSETPSLINTQACWEAQQFNLWFLLHFPLEQFSYFDQKLIHTLASLTRNY